MDTLHVCISCRYHADQRFLNGKRGGLLFFEALDTKMKAAGLSLKVRPSECLSACRSYCTLVFTGPRKLSMVFGRLDAAALDETCDALVSYAKSYTEKADGYVLRTDRPILLQDKLIARVPSSEGMVP